MVGSALLPGVIGRAIDAGVADRDTAALARWTLVIVGIGGFTAAVGVLAHRAEVSSWLTAALRTEQLVARHAVALGAALPRRVATGEVVSVSASDLNHIGNAMEIIARTVTSLSAVAVVSTILLTTTPQLGLVVLVGVPLLVMVIGPLMRPLERRHARQRHLVGGLSTLASDVVAGLRVLRGIGGEDIFVRRYRESSQDARAAGIRVGSLQSTLDAAQVLLPGGFVILVTWLGARLALEGQISIGELVAFYGYAAFLMTPLRILTNQVGRMIRAVVAARRVVAVLALEPEFTDPNPPAPEPPRGVELIDNESGLVVRPGLLTAVASPDPEQASALADRLGRYVDADVTLGGVALRDLPLATVRRRVLVSHAEAQLFRGRLHEELAGSAAGVEKDRVLSAVRAADADDVVHSLLDGLDSEVEERGRSFSGGQRQRLILARALIADPEILVLDEPSNAVDAHTEARIAKRLRAHRSGRTTVVLTTSPLLLDRTDRVVFLEDGTVAAEGTHRELLASHSAYRVTVTRGEELDSAGVIHE